MASFWRKMGVVFEKPSIEKKELSPEAKAELAKYHKELGSLHEKMRMKVSEDYFKIIPKALILRAMEHNDYLCTQWGSRKFGRLVNISRNILDIEINSEEGYKFVGKKKKILAEEAMILKLLVLAALLFPIPLKKQIVDMDADEKYTVIFKEWLVDEFKIIGEEEYNIVAAMIFGGVKNKPGNVIVDIFHDALKFEEAQFGFKFNEKEMRTVLGHNGAYKSKVLKESERNLSPGWLENFQEKYALSGFFDVEKGKEDNAYMGDDGIT